MPCRFLPRTACLSPMTFQSTSLLTSLPFPQYIINCTQPVSDKIFDLSAFEKFLHDKIKVEGRVGNLGDSVNISQVGDGKIEVVTHIPFSGRYLKYL
jgi:large subunit ribosomal protein L22e